MITDNLILYLPFDEQPGSVKAYDFSNGGNHAALSIGTLLKRGKSGNCVNFNGWTKGNVTTSPLVLMDNFTISFYFKSENIENQSNPKQLGIQLVFDGVNQYEDGWIDIVPGQWQHIVLVKDYALFHLYVDGVLVKTIDISDYNANGLTLQGFSFLQDSYEGNYGHGDIDEFMIYNVAFPSDEIGSLLDNTQPVVYSIDNHLFSDYGINVSGSKGIVDALKMKTPLTTDWDDYHGEVVDLSHPRYSPRDISLECWIKAGGKSDFVCRVRDFVSMITTAGLHQLIINVHPTKPLIYMVYCKDGMDVDKQWNEGLMVGKFTLTLREPEPVKMILKHITTGTENDQASFTLTTTKLVNIYWGDGTATYNVSGTAQVKTHDYINGINNYIVITGVIEDITNFSTNEILVWSKF